MEKLYQFTNNGLEVFSKNNIDSILDGSQKSDFVSVAEEILVKINILRADLRRMTLEDCLLIRHLGFDLNYQNLLICPF